MADALALGRRAFADWRWRVAFDRLSAADRDAGLEPEDLERLGDAAYLVGDEDSAVAAWTRAHKAFAGRDECLRAARLGFWLSLALLLGGKQAQSSGWLSRTQRMLVGREGECSEHGLVLVVRGLFSMFKGDAEEARVLFEQATALGERFRNTDLLACSVLSHGQALIQMQRTDEGIRLLDESMVAVTSGQVSPIMAGVIYCAVIITCERACDLQRAHEWTVALDEWCRSQPELVAFRGQCLVHRSEVMRFKGDWVAARAESERACELLSDRSRTLLGRALYQQGELHRLTGELDRADEAYRRAGEQGFEPQPGVSLLRLAQGKPRAAVASIRRVQNEASSQQGPGAGLQRIKILGPFAEIMLATGELEPARAAADELVVIARKMEVPFVTAVAAHTTGALLLACGDAESALMPLREGWTVWQKLDAPYEAARVRVLIGRACRQLGDTDTERLHLDAAAEVFERLGAAPDLAGLRGDAPAGGGAVAGLSKRERQVLALVALGKTNHQIADKLGISEHTVARHLSNIFDKLGVNSRTAASAIAFQHGIT